MPRCPKPGSAGPRKRTAARRTTTDWAAVIPAICARIAEGESLRAIVRGGGYPAMSNIMQQLARDASFRELYEIARAQQAEVYFDEMIEIADDARNDWMEANGADDAGWRANKENVQRSRLRIDTRKWMLSKMLPKKYGDLAAGTAPNEHAEELRKLRQLMLTGRSDVDAPENP